MLVRQTGSVVLAGVFAISTLASGVYVGYKYAKKLFVGDEYGGAVTQVQVQPQRNSYESYEPQLKPKMRYDTISK